MFTNSDYVVPWSNIWKATCRHRLVLYGYPSGRVRDPIKLRMQELRQLIDRLYAGECGFRRITEDNFRELLSQRQAAILAGRLEPTPRRKARSDRGDVRGRHENPETRTQTRRRGKVICSPAIIEDEIEDWTEDEKKVTGVPEWDPIEEC